LFVCLFVYLFNKLMNINKRENKTMKFKELSNLIYINEVVTEIKKSFKQERLTPRRALPRS